MYKGYLIDLDGTAYRGTEVINETLAFVKRLQAKDIPYLFLTNNTTKTPEMVAEFLKAFGYPVTENQIYTPSLATAQYIYEQNPKAKVYMIGEIGLKAALIERGLQVVDCGEEADYVVSGLDRDINYEKYTQACIGINKGAHFIVTNGDRAIPTEAGLRPGNGALASVISVCTGVEPTLVGKPHKLIMDKALELMDLPKTEVAMIGDNYLTDILAGIQAGIPTIYIEGGVSSREDVLSYTARPTHILKDLSLFDV